jgi:hypothetical protein
MMMGMSETTTDVEYWTGILNDRAAEFGLEKTVEAVKPRSGEVGVTTWVYRMESGELIDLGWSVEIAEAGLRSIAGA